MVPDDYRPAGAPEVRTFGVMLQGNDTGLERYVYVAADQEALPSVKVAVSVDHGVVADGQAAAGIIAGDELAHAHMGFFSDSYAQKIFVVGLAQGMQRDVRDYVIAEIIQKRSHKTAQIYNQGFHIFCYRIFGQADCSA